MQMCSAMVYCKIILRGNKSCRGNESGGGEREEGKLYYLVVAAMGPNYGYAFVSVLKTFPPLFKKQKYICSLCISPLSHFLSHIHYKPICLKQVFNCSSSHNGSIFVPMASHIISEITFC